MDRPGTSNTEPAVVRALRESDLAWILDLNRSLEAELSPLNKRELAGLARTAFSALVAAPANGFLLAFDHDAAYGSPNFLWFRQRLSDFVYIDRIAITRPARRRGLARHLYRELLEQARTAGLARIVCEVNISPPNPVSDALHAGLGFTEIGRDKLENGKSVRYLTRVL